MSARLRPEQIAASLRRAVRERVLAPGEALNQDELARRYGVSRIPVREALRTLVGEGLIVMQPGLGAVVTKLESDEVNELYGLRLALEPGLAVDVVANARLQDIAQLSAMADEMASLGPTQSDRWSNLNYGFVRRLYEISDRRHVMRLVVQVLNLVEPYSRVYAHVLGSRELLQSQRTAMLMALRDHDAEGLRRLIVSNIEGARAQLVESMTADVDGGRDDALHPFPSR
jgi:DNA-binding GntR family transcriptional regulator